MDYTRLGNTGLKVSRICLGMMSYGDPNWRDWTLPEDESRAFVKRAVELGINFFDTANVYSLGASEEVTGRLLKEFAKRDEVVIATTVHGRMGSGPNQGGLSRKHIMESADASLKRLGTDYIDLYQIHRWSNDTPIEETLAALNDLVRMGKVRYIGASSMFAWQFAKSLYLAEMKGWSRFVSMQNHYNLVYREEEREMNSLCVAEGVGLIPWSPLARGFLAGNRHRSGGGETTRAKSDGFAEQMYYQETDFEVVERAIKLGQEKNFSSAQIALAWLLHQPGVAAPIIGATKMRHLEEAVAAVDIKFSTDEVEYLEEPYQPHPVLGHSS
jgi:aryl-alcohol dehydrogenase (NADP+)